MPDLGYDALASPPRGELLLTGPCLFSVRAGVGGWMHAAAGCRWAAAIEGCEPCMGVGRVGVAELCGPFPVVPLAIKGSLPWCALTAACHR